MGVPVMGISKPPLESPGTKWHLGVGHVAMHRVYYKGEGGGFPQVWVIVIFESLFARGSSMHQNVLNMH
jgi:hypothetical protein